MKAFLYGKVIWYMKNIAVIATSLNSGGAERIAGLLSKELSKYYNVYLFLLNTKNIVYEYGGIIVDVGLHGEFYEYPIKYYKNFYHIDLAISFLEIINFVNIRTRENEKIIISERCVQSLMEPEHISETYKIKKYYNFADEIVSCSEGVKYDLIHNYGINNRITTIYNFIDKQAILLKAYEKIDSEVESFLRGTEYFINVGRLHPQKNQKRLILQFSYFHNKHQNIKLLIVGSGKLEYELESYIADLGLVECVKIIPYTTNPFKYMVRAKALILASHYEGLPNVILEAMILGCPVLATDCLAGPRELLLGESDYNVSLKKLEVGNRGILVCDDPSEDDGTSQYMAQAIELLYSETFLPERLGKNGQAFMEQYSNQKIIDKWISIIEKCVRKEPYINFLEAERSVLDIANHIIIYGAGFVGRNIFLKLHVEYRVDAFVVTYREKEEKELFGVPIQEISEVEYSPDETAVIIGVGNNYQDEVLYTLKEYGFERVVFPYIELSELNYKRE